MAKRTAEVVLKRFLAAADVIPFVKAVKNPHIIKIHGEKYFLSDDGGPLGTAEEQAEWAGDARVIMGPGAGKFKYLWIYDTDKQLVTMWRAHDGNEKVHQRASTMQVKIVKLSKKSQINRVDHKTFVIIEREMTKAADQNLQALKQWSKELEGDFQKKVNDLVQSYFDAQVRPEIERALSAVESGAIPFGYKPFGEPEDQQRHMMTKTMSDVMSRKFTEPLLVKWLKEQGVDLEDPMVDGQAAYWAVNEIADNAYTEYLPERAT